MRILGPIVVSQSARLKEICTAKVIECSAIRSQAVLSCLDGALLASRFLSLMLLRGGLGEVMSPALMRGTL